MVDFLVIQNDIKKMISELEGSNKDETVAIAILNVCTVLNHGLHGIAEAIELQKSDWGR